MAKTKYPTLSPELRASDVAVNIYPRGFAEWSGSAAQLIAEGLIPDKFEWPHSSDCKRWRAGLFECFVHRMRPADMKGPQSLWKTGDYWRLRTTLAAQGMDGFAAARIYEAQANLKRELWVLSQAGRCACNRFWRARMDEPFQGFLRLAMGIPEASR